MYNLKLVKINDNAEWYNDKMDELGAGPNVKDSILKRRVYCEVYNDANLKLHDAELLVDEPFSVEGFDVAVKEYISQLPTRHADEGRLEARVDAQKKVELYRDDVKISLKEAEPILTK
jgi:hypothetical protein